MSLQARQQQRLNEQGGEKCDLRKMGGLRESGWRLGSSRYGGTSGGRQGTMGVKHGSWIIR